MNGNEYVMGIGFSCLMALQISWKAVTHQTLTSFI